jgi:hypothetical protein
MRRPPVHDFNAACCIVNKDTRHPARARLLRDGFAEKVILLHRGESRVRIAAADEAKFVGVRAELLLELQAVLVGRADVFEFEHLFLLCDAAIEVAFVPNLESSKLIVR